MRLRHVIYTSDIMLSSFFRFVITTYSCFHSSFFFVCCSHLVHPFISYIDASKEKKWKKKNYANTICYMAKSIKKKEREETIHNTYLYAGQQIIIQPISFSSCCFSIVHTSMFLICMMMISSFMWASVYLFLGLPLLLLLLLFFILPNGMPLVRHTTLSRALSSSSSIWTV